MPPPENVLAVDHANLKHEIAAMSTSIRFVLGALGGSLVAYFAGFILLNMTESADITATDMAFRTPHEIESQRWQRHGPMILAVSVMGFLLGGVTAAIIGSKADAANPRGARREFHRTPSMPLDSEQFQRVLATCGWANMRDKSSDYVQGLIVGRLADSNPVIAQRVERLDEFELEALVGKILRHRNRVSGNAH